MLSLEHASKNRDPSRSLFREQIAQVKNKRWRETPRGVSLGGKIADRAVYNE